MRDRRRIAVGLLVVACLMGVFIAVGTAREETQASATPEVKESLGERPAASKEMLECTGAREEANFRLYSLGRSFEGLPLTTIVRRCDNPARWGSANYVSYIYGTCDPAPRPGEEGGCAPPLELQIWPSCERGPRGGGTELATADSTVVIFGNERARVERAVSAVQPLERGSVPATFPPRLEKTDTLPPPIDAETDC